MGHTTAVRFAPEDIPICARAKAKTLGLLQRHVGETIQKPPAELIGAVLLVLSFEVCPTRFAANRLLPEILWGIANGRGI